MRIYFEKPTLAFLVFWFSTNDDEMTFGRENFRKLHEETENVHHMVIGTKEVA